jgi:hypothetical protein
MINENQNIFQSTAAFSHLLGKRLILFLLVGWLVGGWLVVG